MLGTQWKLQLLTIVTLAAACGSDAPSAPLFSGTTVEITGAPNDGVLLADDVLQLTAVVRDADGAEITSIRPTWSSSDASLATVSTDGRVLGLQPGDVSVRVNAAGATDARVFSVRTRVPLPGNSGPPLVSTLLNEAVQITLSAGAVPEGGVLHLRALDDVPANSRLVNGSVIELGPSGLTFGAAVTLALRFPSSVATLEQPFLRLHRLNDGAWQRVPGGSVDLAARRVMGAITRSGTYAILRPAGAATLLKDAGDGQIGLVGAFVGIAPRVLVLDAEGVAVQGAPIRFSISGGGGAIVGEATATSDAAGRAALPGQWRLGPTGGSNTLNAELLGGSIAPVTFTANAETVTLVIARELAGAISGRTASTQPRLEFRTSGGTLLNVSDGVSVELLSGSGSLRGTLRVDAVGGVVTFTDLRIDGSGEHQLRFTSGGRQLSGGAFTVTQELASLQIVMQPGGAEEDEEFTQQPVIQLLDDAGLAFLPPTQVTAAVASGPGDLRGGRTLTSVAGRVTFSNLWITRSGTHRLRFDTTSPTRSVTSDAFVVRDD